MSNTPDTIENIAERLLNRMNKTAVEIRPGYLCSKTRKNVFVSFMVFKEKSDMPMFEISLGLRGRFVYKHGKKFTNPAHFYELFNAVREKYAEQIKDIEKSGKISADLNIARAQDIILQYFEKHNITQH